MIKIWTIEEILLLDQAVKNHLTTEDVHTLAGLIDRIKQLERRYWRLLISFHLVDWLR